MASNVYDDMPQLVDANIRDPQYTKIPPPAGAAYAGNDLLSPHNGMHQGFENGQEFARPSPQSFAQYPGDDFQASQFKRSPWPQTTPSPWSSAAPSPYIPQPSYTHDTYTDHVDRDSNRTGPSPLHNRQNSSNLRHSSSPWHGSSPSWDQSTAQQAVKRPPLQSSSTSAIGYYAQFSTLQRSMSMSDQRPSRIVLERPSEWRRGFKFRSGLSTIFQRKRSQSVAAESIDSSNSTLHEYLRHDNSGNSPTVLDLRRPPYTIVVQSIRRPLTQVDIQQFACEPPALFMRLYHNRLPWYIDIRTTNNVGITLEDLFLSLCAFLDRRIQKSDYWNEELDDADRDELRRAWEQRCRTHEERMNGVKRIDFLRGKVMFDGLVKGKGGMWQLKTYEPGD